MVKVNNFVWQTPAGPIRGWQADGVNYATAIPYGYAERFHYPEALAPSSVEIAAYQSGLSCVQKADQYFAEKRLPMSYQEAPLTLSITSPLHARRGAELPVMVWIHGGYYTIGSGDSRLYKADLMVKEQNVIVVAINYRLAVFGYTLDYEEQPANLGLLDQQLALQWIKRNIASFGGNPNNITLFGQSAGADAVAHLMLLPDASDLFQRVIIQSMPLGSMKGRRRMNDFMLAELKAYGVQRKAADMVAFQMICEHYSVRQFGLAATMPFGVKYGVYPLPTEQEVMQKWAEVAQEIEILIGYNKNECATFVADMPVFGPIWRKAWGRLLLQPVVSLLNKCIFEWPIRKFVKHYRKAGGRIGRYEIEWGASMAPTHSGHCVELPLLFGDTYYRKSDMIADMPSSAFDTYGPILRRIWVDFARTGRLDVSEHQPFFHLWF